MKRLLVLVLGCMLLLSGCGGGGGGASVAKYSTADLAGTWVIKGLIVPKNGEPDYYGYDTFILTFNSNGAFTGTGTSFDGSPSWAESGTGSVSSDGVVTLTASDGTPWGRNAVMAESKDVVIGSSGQVFSGGESVWEISVFEKIATSYSQADLAGTWVSRGLMTPQNGGVDNFGYDNFEFVVDASGNFTGTGVSSDGSPAWLESGTMIVSAGGVVTFADAGGSWGLEAVLASGKNIITSNSQKANDVYFDVFVKKATSYSNADLVGVWKNRGLMIKANGGADNFDAYSVSVTVNSDYTFSVSGVDGDGSTWSSTGSISVASDGVVTVLVTGSGSFECVMDSSKMVMIRNDQEADSHSFEIFVKN